MRDAIRDAGVDPGRIYLAGRGASAAWVFYAIARLTGPVGRRPGAGRVARGRGRDGADVCRQFHQRSRAVGRPRDSRTGD